MKDYSIYPGIVIQNNDPDKGGKVKVFVPGITNTIYDAWNDKSIDRLFSGIDEDLIPIMQTLKEDLPWAECGTSLFGGDSGQLTHQESPIPLERTSNAFITTPPKDAFEQEKYTPGDYSGTSAGLYSIPSVGSHVYVFFKRGNTNYPVYLASTHSMDEWQGILKDNYPTDYENSLNSEGEYHNKHVLNTSKHTLEFIDSDGIEEIKLSHFSGSNIQMLNDYTSTFTVGDNFNYIKGNYSSTIGVNAQEKILGDSTASIDGNHTIEIGENETITVGGAHSEDVGGNQSVTVGGNLTFKVTGSIILESAGGKIVLDASGVTITGTAINLN